MNYYTSMLIVLVGLKITLVLLLVGPWLWQRFLGSDSELSSRIVRRSMLAKLNSLEHEMRGRSRKTVLREIQRSMSSVQREVIKTDWVKIFKASFMLLFVAYPGASHLPL